MKILATYSLLFSVAVMCGCGKSDTPTHSTTTDSASSGMMAPNPTVPGGSMANPAISNGMNVEEEPSPSVPGAPRSMPGSSPDLAALADIGHRAHSVIHPGPKGFLIDLTYDQPSIARLIQLPQSARPSDPAEALRLWMSVDPPKLDIPPHMIPIEGISKQRNDGKTAVLNFVSAHSGAPGIATLTKERANNDSVWVVTRVQEMH